MRWVDLDARPCLTCDKEGKCDIPISSCEWYNDWYKGVDVVPMQYHEKCMTIQLKKRIGKECGVCDNCIFYELVDGNYYCKIWQVFGKRASPKRDGYCHCWSKRTVDSN